MPLKRPKRPKLAPKPKKLSPSQYKKKLWAIFSEYIKLRDGTICITCMKRCEGSGRHAGHFIPSSVGGAILRYHENNVHVQCFRCNIHLGGWGERYAEIMEARYGRTFVEGLRQLMNTTIKADSIFYEEKIKEYTEKLEKLKSTPNSI